MSRYDPVMGLEIHVELNTKSKMFCRCAADYFGKKPNTHTCPICLGLPGALPYINEAAIKKCLQIGLALNCSVPDESLFERKNYFYPDLAKGYQISQYRWPLSVNGEIEVDGLGGNRRIRINRVHQEEDTAKLVHQLGNSKSQNPNSKKTRYSYIDFNRSGVPLVEIVTEPDFRHSSEVKDYAKKLQQLFRYLGVSNADMEKGDMRLEANISLRELKTQNSKLKTELPNYRVELKNINSFNFMVAAVEYEIKRQAEALERGEKMVQETRGWDQVKKQTYIQREKEEANDYRYFPEPDLPELSAYQRISVSEIQKEIPELPWYKAKRYVDELGLSKADAKILSEDKKYAEFFEKCVEVGFSVGITPKQIANYLINQKIGRTDPGRVVGIIQSRGIGVIGEVGEIEELARGVINENQHLVEAYRKGKTTVIMALIGAVMKKTAGKADPVKTKELLEKLLS